VESTTDTNQSPTTDTTTQKLVITQERQGRYPQTADLTNMYWIFLGILLCLIVIVIRNIIKN
ncbi:hypothetical protein KUA55_17995, partial [Enterococcus sp. ALS3]